MNRPEIFYKSVNALQRAYYKDYLQHRKVCACAVANLILAAHGLSPLMSSDGLNWPTSELLYAPCGIGWYGVCHNMSTKPPDKELNAQIKPTGYSWEELRKIESAFESVKSYIDTDGYLGLCAVLDTLMEIHEFNDPIPEREEIFSKKELKLVEGRS